MNDVPISMFLMATRILCFIASEFDFTKDQDKLREDVYRDVFYMVVVAALAIPQLLWKR